MKNSCRAILISVFCFSLLGLNVTASAATSPKKAPFPDTEDAGFDAGVIQSALSRVKAARKLADTNRTYGESDLSDAFKIYRDKFLKITTADQLEDFLTETDAAYDTFPTDLKYFVAQAQIIRPFRSIVFRLRPIFEHDKGIQSAAVTGLRELASTLMIYLPTPGWEAGFAYLTIPSRDHEDTNVQFHSISEFQNFLMSTSHNFAKQTHRVAVIYKARVENKDNSPLVWDNRLFYGTNSFPDPADRYRVHGDGEIAAFLAGMHGDLERIATFCAYDQDDLLNIAQDLGHQAGINGFTFLEKIEGQDTGVSAKDRAKIFKKSKYRKFMTLKGDNATTDSSDSGAMLLAKAFKHLGATVNYANESWEVLRNSSANSFAFFNPLQFQGNETQATAMFANMKAMVTSKTTLRSAVTGETTEIDLPNFFVKNPPQDLKAFLPTDFDDSIENEKMTTTSGKNLSYHNYFRGRAIGWNVDAWKTIAPDVSNPQHVATVMRILSQNWGGDFLAAFLDVGVR